MRPLIVVITEGARSFARRKLRSAHGSLEAAEALLAHTLAVAKEVGDVRVCAPDGSDAVELARTHEVPWIRQATGALGARVAAALATVRAQEPPFSSRPVILLGDDCPGLTAEDLDAAVLALERGAGSVAGRAKDGGFWLLGLASIDAALVSALCTRVAWCTPDAFTTLSDVLVDQLGSRPALLDERSDLDAIEDVPLCRREAHDDLVRAFLWAIRPGLANTDVVPKEEPPLFLAGSPSRPRPPPRA